jgi:hypothetical protein
MNEMKSYDADIIGIVSELKFQSNFNEIKILIISGYLPSKR